MLGGLALLAALVAGLAGLLSALDPLTPFLPGAGTSPMGAGGDGYAGCAPTGPAGAVPGYSADQLAVAAVIIAVGRRMGVPEQGWIVALAAALQESGMRNLNHGDQDSLGVFQQRPSQGWGSPQQVMSPVYAAEAFYRHLLAIPGWQHMSVTDAAQAVQRSATPTAYATHEPAARALVAALAATTCTPAPGAGQAPAHPAGPDTPEGAPTTAAAAALAFARSQLGRPYLWGGTGNGGFDCSGLVQQAYRAAGITLPRTADAQYRAGPHLPQDQPLLPGDLVFYGNPATSITHVGIYAGDGKIIHAPTQGSVVQLAPLPTRGYAGASRPTAQQMPHQGLVGRIGEVFTDKAPRNGPPPTWRHTGEGAPDRALRLVDWWAGRPNSAASPGGSPHRQGQPFMPSTLCRPRYRISVPPPTSSRS